MGDLISLKGVGAPGLADSPVSSQRGLHLAMTRSNS